MRRSRRLGRELSSRRLDYSGRQLASQKESGPAYLDTQQNHRAGERLKPKTLSGSRYRSSGCPSRRRNELPFLIRPPAGPLLDRSSIAGRYTGYIHAFAAIQRNDCKEAIRGGLHVPDLVGNSRELPLNDPRAILRFAVSSVDLELHSTILSRDFVAALDRRKSEDLVRSAQACPLL